MSEAGLDGVPEAADVQQASGDGGVEVAEAQGHAPEGLEPSATAAPYVRTPTWSRPRICCR